MSLNPIEDGIEEVPSTDSEETTIEELLSLDIEPDKDTVETKVEKKDSKKKKSEEEEDSGESESSDEDNPEEGNSEEDAKETEDVEDSDEETSFIADFAKEYGIDPEEVADYEDSEAGLHQFTQDLANTLAQNYINEYVESNPELAKFARHLNNGGTAEDYFSINHPATDYSKINLSEEDTSTAVQKSLVKDWYLSQGIEESAIIQHLDGLEAGGTLFSQAVLAKQALVAKQKREQADYERTQKELALQKQEQAKELLIGIRDTLTKTGEIAGITIPRNQHNDLIAYMTQPVKGNYTKRDLDAGNLSLEKQVLLSYLLMTDLDLKQVVNIKARKQQALGLKKQINKQKQSPKTKAKPKATQETPELGAISFEE